MVTLGVGLLLESLGLLDFSTTFHLYWPLLVILAGLASLVSNQRVIVWPMLVIAVGLLLLMRQLDLLNFDIWQLVWPGIIIVLGLSLAFGRTGGRQRQTDVDTIDAFTAFGGQNIKSVSDGFKGGMATALFGGIAIDLRKAKLHDKATLEVFAGFGGIEVKVPEGWNVHITGLPILGGWEDKTEQPADKKAPTLYIRGTCFCGGVEVKN